MSTMENRAQAIRTAPLVESPLWSCHIEKPKVAFRIAILRAASRNVFFQPEHWQIRRILAETCLRGNASCTFPLLLQP
jgi:hypothetical protein